ncbi:MAG: hypothetical protein VW338_19320, partial [Rhodospirillaceae bacterium]
LWTGANVHVIDEVDGAVTAFSDGTNWRRITDRAIVSAALPTALSSDGVADVYLSAVVGPYLISTGAATVTFVGAMYGAAALESDGVGEGTLQTPPKVPTDVDTDGAATATMVAAARLSTCLYGVGAATATAYGEAA